MRPQLYYSGESLNIGLKWTDLSKEEVNVSAADEIKVLLVERLFKRTIATYSKRKGTITINQDKCIVTITSETTKNLEGIHDVVIEITVGGKTQKAVSDVAINFVKPNN